MTTSPVRHERRAAQRFDYQLPISVRIQGAAIEHPGLTQDLSARGAFFYTETAISEGTAVELTFSMPAEITLTDNMRVRCRGKVLRVTNQDGVSKIGVAVQLEGYEYLAEAKDPLSAEGTFGRISSLHERPLAAREEAVTSTPPTTR
jgi:hypothetical protein